MKWFMKEGIEKFEGSSNKLFHKRFELGLLHNALFERDQRLTVKEERFLRLCRFSV